MGMTTTLRPMKRHRDQPPKFTCPDCGGQGSRVVDTRGMIATEGVWRRRECETCGARWTTRERREGRPPTTKHKL